MIRLDLDFGPRGYPILIGGGLLGQAGGLLCQHLAPAAVVVSNPTVAAHYLAPLTHSLRDAGVSVKTILIPDGETFKTATTFQQIHTQLLEHGADRKTALIALGGGVVGDLTGFVAATYQRGIDFIQIPTTLLAQVDSSVGGKTGMNHPLGKNMIGAFYQPKAVLIDTQCLDTLPDREFSAGLAEVIKYGMIRDAAFFTWLEQNLGAVMARDQGALAHIIERSCAIKAQIVGADEREAGERAVLNFGHTFGHAIETAMGYGVWLHGEAVAAGMVLATELSCRSGWIETAVLDRLRRLLTTAGLPTQAPKLGAGRYLELMSYDKKSEMGRLRFITLDRLGHADIRSDVPVGLLSDLLDSISADPPAVLPQ